MQPGDSRFTNHLADAKAATAFGSTFGRGTGNAGVAAAAMGRDSFLQGVGDKRLHDGTLQFTGAVAQTAQRHIWSYKELAELIDRKRAKK
jgi:hypothetical protein